MVKSSLKFILKKTGLFSLVTQYINAQVKQTLETEFPRFYIKHKWEEVLKEDIKVIKKMDDDVSIICYPDSKLSELIYKGNFEQQELSFLKDILRSGDIFIDVGANIGLFSILASKHVQPNGKVFTFEPVKTTYDRLLENITLNNLANVTAENTALSNGIGVLDMQISTDGFDAWNSFGKPSAGEAFTTMSIPTTTLDSYLKDNNITVAAIKLIKIDVEGWEVPVIQGGIETLSRTDAPDLLVEFTEANLRGAGFTSDELYKLIQSLGYKWYEFDVQSGTLANAVQRPIYTYSNLVASKKRN